MNWIKKGLSLSMAAIMAGSLAACTVGADTNWVAKSGELTVPAGIYLWEMMNAYYEIAGQLGEDVKNPLKEQIDGVSVSDKMLEEARQGLNEYIAVENKFAEMDLEIDQQMLESIPATVENYWQLVGPGYEKNGISKDSYAKMFENDIRRNQLFQAVYGKGGEKEVSEAELKEKFNSDYAKIIVMPLVFSTSEDAEKKESADKATREMINKYYEKAKEITDSEAMADLVYEAEKEAKKDESLEKKQDPFVFVNKETSQYADEVTEAIFKAELGVPTVVESETSIYLFTRYDVNENPNDFAARKDAVLSQLKFQEFEELIAQWGKELSNVEYNEAAFKRYTPEKLKLD